MAELHVPKSTPTEARHRPERLLRADSGALPSLDSDMDIQPHNLFLIKRQFDYRIR